MSGCAPLELKKPAPSDATRAMREPVSDVAQYGSFPPTTFVSVRHIALGICLRGRNHSAESKQAEDTSETSSQTSKAKDQNVRGQ